MLIVGHSNVTIVADWTRAKKQLHNFTTCLSSTLCRICLACMTQNVQQKNMQYTVKVKYEYINITGLSSAASTKLKLKPLRFVIYFASRQSTRAESFHLFSNTELLKIAPKSYPTLQQHVTTTAENTPSYQMQF